MLRSIGAMVSAYDEGHDDDADGIHHAQEGDHHEHHVHHQSNATHNQRDAKNSTTSSSIAQSSSPSPSKAPTTDQHTPSKASSRHSDGTTSKNLSHLKQRPHGADVMRRVMTETRERVVHNLTRHSSFARFAVTPFFPRSVIPGSLHCGTTRFRHRVFLAFTEPDSKVGIFLALVMVGTILVSIVAFCLSSMPVYRLRDAKGIYGEPEMAFNSVEVFCVSIFTIEYLARIFTVTAVPDANETLALTTYATALQARSKSSSSRSSSHMRSSSSSSAPSSSAAASAGPTSIVSASASSSSGSSVVPKQQSGDGEDKTSTTIVIVGENDNSGSSSSSSTSHLNLARVHPLPSSSPSSSSTAASSDLPPPILVAGSSDDITGTAPVAAPTRPRKKHTRPRLPPAPMTYGCNSHDIVMFFLTSVSKISSFMIEPLNIIDLVAIVPFYVSILQTAANTSNGSLTILRVLRLARVLRLFKMSKRMQGWQIMAKTLWKAADALGFLVFFVILAMILFGSLIFFCEGGEYDPARNDFIRPNMRGDAMEPTPYQSIPHSFWWAMVTMMTLGYGDFVPTTDGGRAIASFLMLMSILVLAMPISVIGNSFTAEYNLAKRARAAQVAALINNSNHMSVLTKAAVVMKNSAAFGSVASAATANTFMSHTDKVKASHAANTAAAASGASRALSPSGTQAIIPRQVIGAAEDGGSSSGGQHHNYHHSSSSSSGSVIAVTTPTALGTTTMTGAGFADYDDDSSITTTSTNNPPHHHHRYSNSGTPSSSTGTAVNELQLQQQHLLGGNSRIQNEVTALRAQMERMQEDVSWLRDALEQMMRVQGIAEASGGFMGGGGMSSGDAGGEGGMMMMFGNSYPTSVRGIPASGGGVGGGSHKSISTGINNHSGSNSSHPQSSSLQGSSSHGGGGGSNSSSSGTPSGLHVHRPGHESTRNSTDEESGSSGEDV